ncbi:N-acetylglucosaminylphosphatidylinositol deacetylase [Cryptococcus neoformans Ze90-1]|nr:N-acetylglucosaminylphosphatidylinositol deacetylase [Cryptococcus neoformans var. grubii Ze90-1]
MPPAQGPGQPRPSAFPFLFAVIFPLFRLLFSLTPIAQPQDFNLLTPESIAPLGDKPSALIVTAHPDDEVMFFSPTILGLIGAGWNVRGLCLSTGNSEGLGEKRKGEFVKSYEALGIPAENLEITDHPDLPDGLTTKWNTTLVSTIIQDSLFSNPVDIVVTFDPKGITSHPNHVTLPSSLALIPAERRPRVLALQSPDTLPKFTGPLYIVYLHLRTIFFSPQFQRAFQFLFPSFNTFFGAENVQETQAHVMINDLRGWATGLKAMMAHHSQLVWFRYLYVAFSRLMWVNELVEVTY